MDPAEREARLEREFKESYTLRPDQSALQEKREQMLNRAAALINESFAFISDDHACLQTRNDLLRFKGERFHHQIR